VRQVGQLPELKMTEVKKKDKKMKAHKVLAKSVYNYGSETRTIRKQDERRLTSEEIKFILKNN
jgi:hypothetical protein